MADKTCFVIAPIGNPDSKTRKRSDQVFKHVISPAATECGYGPIRADQIAEPGLITTQVIQYVVDSPLVIADLTERNPNVFYELALRHAIRKPFVQLIKAGEQIPFDVAGTRTITFDHQDLDSAEEAKSEIIRQIKFLEDSSSEIQTPISVSLDLQLLRESENPEHRSFADILSSLAGISRTLSSLEQRIGRQPSIPETLIDELVATSQRLAMMGDEVVTMEKLKHYAQGGQMLDVFQRMRQTTTQLRTLINTLAELRQN